MENVSTGLGKQVYKDCCCSICGKDHIRVATLTGVVNLGDFNIDICEECAVKIVSLFKNKEK